METAKGLSLRGEAAEADALAELRSLSDALCVLRKPVLLVCVVYEVTPSAVGAEADGVKGATRLGLVLRVSVEASQLLHPVSELAFGAVFAGGAFLVGAAELRLIAGGHWRCRGHSQCLWAGQGAVADAETRRRRKRAGRQALAGHMALNHAHGPIYSEGDLVQGGTWQLLLLLVAPVLVDGRQRPGAAVVAVEFRVGKSHGAQGMPALESHHTLLLCGFCQINTAETLGTEKDLSILCGAQVSMKQESN